MLFFKNKYDPKVFFLHIQKTAGTSVLHLASTKYKESMITHGDYQNMDTRKVSKLAFVAGHFGFNYNEGLLNSRYSFTFLRNPVERILSLYYFCRNQTECDFPIYRLAQQLTLEQFLKEGFEPGRIKSHIWNHQTWMLACGRDNARLLEIEDFDSDQLLDDAMINLKKFSHVGFVESFSKDINVISNALGLHVYDNNMATNVTNDRPKADDLSSSTIDLLYELTALDQELYNHWWGKANEEPAPLD